MGFEHLFSAKFFCEFPFGMMLKGKTVEATRAFCRHVTLRGGPPARCDCQGTYYLIALLSAWSMIIPD